MSHIPLFDGVQYVKNLMSTKMIISINRKKYIYIFPFSSQMDLGVKMANLLESGEAEFGLIFRC